MRSVTIVIPAYNPGAYLDETVQSVIAQSYEDWECVLVDDGSSEDLSRFDTIHPRVRRIRQPNRGLSIARNEGILSSQSEFVAFVDADDLWQPGKLKAQIELLRQRPQMGFCHTAFEIIDEKGAVVKPGFGKDVKGYLGLLGSSSVCVSTVVVRRSCLSVSGLFDPLLHAVQDFDMWLKIARFYDIGFLPESQALYRVHSANMSGNPQLMAREVTDVLSRHAPLAAKKGDKRALKVIGASIRGARLGWGCFAFDKARAALGERNGAEFRRHFATSLQLAPLYTVKTTLSYLGQRLSRRS